MKIKLSDTICITDPCYPREFHHCAAFDFKIKEGDYLVDVQYSNEGDWGMRVKSLSIFHDTVKVSHNGFKLNKDVNVSVDSGQAGFFCNSIYPQGKTGDYHDKTSFYGQVCNATHGDDVEDLKHYILEHQAIIKLLPNKKDYYESEINLLKNRLKKAEESTKPYGYDSILEAGVVSSSGFGDGGYPLYEKKNSKGEVVALKIKFI